MEKSESMVELNHVKKAYKSKVLFTDLNLKVQRGESCAIAGVNGSGKSVLFKMICGLVRPDEGEVIVGGGRIEKGKFPQDIGVMLDTVGFLPNETGLKNLAVIAGIRRKATRGEVEDAMRLAGLNPASRVKVGEYTLEMKRRLAIAQALMERPSLLILDEPFDGIDRHMVRNFRQLLERLNMQEGVTILMTFRRLKDIQDLCGSVYQIDEGSLKKLEAQEVALQSLIENIKE